MRRFPAFILAILVLCFASPVLASGLSASVTIAGGGELFASGNETSLDLVLSNGSALAFTDVAVTIVSPSGVDLSDTELHAERIAAGGTYSFAVTARKAAADNSGAVTALAVVVAALGAALVVLAVLVLRDRRRLKRLVAAVVALFALFPVFLTSAHAVQSASEERFEEELTLEVPGSREPLHVVVSYKVERSLYLTVAGENEGALLSWNSESGCTEFDIYSGSGEDVNFLNSVSNVNSYFVEYVPANTPNIFYVVGRDGAGNELLSNTAVFIMTDDGVFADSDSDLVSDENEAAFGLSPTSADTDGDGLTDFYELTVTFTDPLSLDSDGDGVTDGSEDEDGDGLTALDECAAKTNPHLEDTDGDGLADGFETTAFGSSPTVADTDDDGLEDGTELLLNTDPTHADTDGDGVADGDATYTAVITGENTDATVTATASGRSFEGAGVTDITADTTIADADYIVSGIIRVDMTGITDSANAEEGESAEGDSGASITIKPHDVPENDIANVAVFGYDADKSAFVPVEGSVADAASGTVTAPVGRFTMLAAIYLPHWHMQFDVPLSPDRDPNAAVYVDAAFVIDESSSMEDSSKGVMNDPERYRVTAAKEFTTALMPGDRASVIGFNEGARRKCSLTEDMDEARTAMDAIVGNAGGTALHSGLNEALSELIAAQDVNRGRFIIALTDGQDSEGAGDAYELIIDACVQHGIPIFTIGLGSDVNTALLTQLANFTGGQYYNIASAEDLPMAFWRIAQNAVFANDTDGDGLADEIETHGIRDGMGNTYYTDPNDRFTDGDDIQDGDEVGGVYMSQPGDNGETVSYYIVNSDPTVADTDGDGLDDLDERTLGTLAWNRDTDGDGLTDGLEAANGFDPLNANPDGDRYGDALEYDNAMLPDDELIIYLNENMQATNPMGYYIAKLLVLTKSNDPFFYDLSMAEKYGALLEGALLGDFGEWLSQVGLLDEERAASLYYSLGSAVVGAIPGANVVCAIRDAIGCVLSWDMPGLVAAVIELIPVAGGLAKAVLSVCEWILKACDVVQETYDSLGLERMAKMPGIALMLVELNRSMNDAIGLSITDPEELNDAIEAQRDAGTAGLTKRYIPNWRTFLEKNNTETYNTESLSEGSVSVPFANTALQTDVTSAVRAALGTEPGGTFDGTTYRYVRVLDMDAVTCRYGANVEYALKQAVDFASGYRVEGAVDVPRSLTAVVPDTMVSREVYDALVSAKEYAETNGVALSYRLCLYEGSADTAPQVEPERSENNSAVIILPGAAGSELVAGQTLTTSLGSIEAGDGVWMPDNIGALISDSESVLQGDAVGAVENAISEVCELDGILAMLECYENGRSRYSLLPRAVDTASAHVGALGVFTELYNALVAAYSQAGKDVEFFGYDWRMSAVDAAEKLEAFIDARGYESVTLVCHSMGGIVASAYIASSDANAGKLDKLITIGTPYGGSPKALYTFETGNFLDGGVARFFSSGVFKNLAPNFPSVYGLLPYNSYLQSESYIKGKDAKGIDAFLRSRSWMSLPLYESALALQELLGYGENHIANRPQTNTFIIAGTGVDTVMELKQDGDSMSVSSVGNDGDGTVPLNSATLFGGSASSKPVYYVPGVNHTSLVSNAAVISLVKSIIDSGEDAVIPSGITTTRPSRAGGGRSFTVKCPAAIVVKDENGSIVGIATSKRTVTAAGCEDMFYSYGDNCEKKQVFLSNDSYEVLFVGEAEGEMDVEIVTLDADGTAVAVERYEDAKIAAGSVSTARSGQLSTDIDSDGKADEVLTAPGSGYGDATMVMLVLLLVVELVGTVLLCIALAKTKRRIKHELAQPQAAAR